MNTILHAQPYDLSAQGFYFSSLEEYQTKSKNLKNSCGQLVEEFEIQFIDGEPIDVELADTWGINQANIGEYFEAIDNWDEDRKTRFIIAVGECSYSFDPKTVSPDDYDIDIYHVDSLKELAEQFVDEGLFGEIPKALEYYIDHEAIARDLSADYSMTEIAGVTLAYRCV